MAKSVFYSFHYQRDNWRVQQIMQMGALEGQTILNSQDWEAVRRRGDPAVEGWIAEQMAYRKAVVVLVGAQTAGRPWVRYEIRKAWRDRRPLVGIRVHGLEDRDGNTDVVGTNPFTQISLTGGGTLADYVPLQVPTGSNSQAVYNNIRANIASWVDGAYAR